MFNINHYIEKGKKYYIYGTKGTGIYCFNKIKEQFGEGFVLGFIETEPKTDECRKKKVYALDEIGYIPEDTRIIIASANYFKEIKENLINKGVEAEKIIVLDGIYPYFKNIKSYHKNIKRVCFWPPIKENNRDIRKKISWFLPDKAVVIVWCEDDIKESFNSNIRFGKKDDIEGEFEEADIIFVWDIKAKIEKLIDYWDKTYVVDPDFWYYTETINFSTIYYKLFSEREKNYFLDESRVLFQKLKLENKEKRANVFCSGPSIDEIYNRKFNSDLNIVTNSMVKDQELLERISPKILIYTDQNFYLSPNEFCKKFYEDVLETVKKYDSYIIVFDDSKPLILHHFPMLRGKVIGIPYDSPEFVFPDVDNFRVKNTGNILTQLLLPIASSLCDEIGIAGCTGRNPDETYYWKHNPKTQYIDLMQSVFDMYPSIFRDQKYDDYYDRHCKTVKDMIKYGEQLGKKYINMTTSYISALNERTIDA